ncbi:MAG: hypothetical protein H7Z16_17340 [Pyrinomonadaceae bacterium]|nr:hypothetical protein [Pyrinomonadaceae bacterium]
MRLRLMNREAQPPVHLESYSGKAEPYRTVRRQSRDPSAALRTYTMKPYNNLNPHLIKSK